MTRMNTEICWRSSVTTDVIIYPQMLDRCYTDFHLFQICLTSVDYLSGRTGNPRKLLKEGEYIHKSCDADPATIEHVVSMRAR